MSEQIIGVDPSNGEDFTVVQWIPCKHFSSNDCPYCRIEALEAENKSFRKSYQDVWERAETAEAKLDAALGIGEVHPSWGPKDDFTRGWKECREQFREALQEKEDGN